MTYVASLQKPAKSAEYPFLPFRQLSSWEEREGSRVSELTEAVYGSTVSSVPLFRLLSGGSRARLAFPEAARIWQEIGGSTVRNFELQVGWVEQLYAFRRPQEVSCFLQDHSFLLPLIEEAYGKIAEYFGPSPEIVLEVITDPETENDSELFAFIRTSLPPEEALDKLHRFDEEWWLDEADRAEGKLCIHVEFQ